VAEAGLALVPADDDILRLRLEGNRAVSGTWAAGRIDDVVRELRRISAAATRRGSDHYAAIAQLNLGVLLREVGEIDASIAALESAARFWSDLGGTPFSENSDLALSLLIKGQPERAEKMAADGVRSTRPWPRPHAEAKYGRGLVHFYRGSFDAVISGLQPLADDPEHLGGLTEAVAGVLIETYFLTGARPALTNQLVEYLKSQPRDIRLEPYRVVADAVAAHTLGGCNGQCRAARAKLAHWATCGAQWPDRYGRARLAILDLDHRTPNVSRIVADLKEFAEHGNVRFIRFWLRRLDQHVSLIATADGGAALLGSLLDADPEYWRVRMVRVLNDLTGIDRSRILERLRRNGSRALIEPLGSVAGDDVADVRRALMTEHAAKVFVRTLGRLEIRRGGWNGPLVELGRQRPKELLGLLVANSHILLTRDQVLDTLWPESSPSGAANSLHQTVYQLRRAMVPDYRDGEGPPYVVSAIDSVRLQPGLVVTDLDEFRNQCGRASSASSPREWEAAVTSIVEVVRGEFLGDMRYEDWVTNAQTRIHAEIRQALLPIALGRTPFSSPDIAIRAATALLSLDEYDEQAFIAIVDRLAESGRRVAARELIGRYATRLSTELSEPPSPELSAALKHLGAESLSI
jgi:DNA-binding SARP family transcriptional activator